MPKDKIAIHTKKFRVKENKKVDLGEMADADQTGLSPRRTNIMRMLAHHVARLSDMQRKLYAGNSHALLLIFQAMDAAGKDGASAT